MEIMHLCALALMYGKLKCCRSLLAEIGVSEAD
jgi:hypothetical protein